MKTKLSKSKKATIMLYVVFIFFMGAIIQFYLYREIYGVESRIYFTGEDALEIIKADTESQKDLVYIDHAAKFSAYQSIYDLAANGGYYSDDFPNIKVNNRVFPLWTNKNFPDYKSNFKSYFNEYMNFFLSNFNIKTKIPKQEFIKEKKKSSLIYTGHNINNPVYHLSFDNTFIYGITTQNLEKRVDKRLSRRKNFQTLTFEKLIGFSLINPSFNIDTGYNIDEYNDLIRNSQILIEFCQNEESKKECVNERLEFFNQDKNFKWELIDYDSETNLFAFNVENKQTKVIATDSEDNTGFKPVIYKFALDISS